MHQSVRSSPYHTHQLDDFQLIDAITAQCVALIATPLPRTPPMPIRTLLVLSFLVTQLPSQSHANSPTDSAKPRIEQSSSKETHSLRVITYNVHGFGPIARKGVDRSPISRMVKAGQLVERFALELELYRPDVIALQEAVPEARVQKLAKRLGMKAVFFPGGWKGKGWPRGIAGAVLTHLPIVESEDCPGVSATNRTKVFSRFFGRIAVKLGEEEVAIYAAHMLPTWKNTTKIRLAEIAVINAAKQRDQTAGRSVIVLGDMNHKPKTDEYRAWLAAGFLDAFAAKGTGPDQSCPSDAPKERIDYVFIHGPLKARLHQCRILHEGAFRLHGSDPSSYALSDHLPVFAVFK